MKTFFRMVLYGAATYLGITIAKEGIETARDPYKRATIKQKFSEIKNIISKKADK